MLPTMVVKCLDLLWPQFDATPIAPTTFDLWMSKGHQNTFTFVINFVFVDWKHQHVTIRLFEANGNTSFGLANKFKTLLEKFGFTSKVLCYVKDEGTNLETTTIALLSIISCEVLNLLTPFVGACLGHALSKVAKYATINDKVSKDLGVVSIKYVQSLLQACITLPKKFGTLIILILALQAFICCAYVLYN